MFSFLNNWIQMCCDSGVNEVQQLLSRFQRNRGERQMEECAVNTQPTGEPSHLVITSPTQRPFMPAVVGVRSSDGTLTCEVIRSTPHSVRVVPRPNVVSISVRDDAPSVIYTNQAKFSSSLLFYRTSLLFLVDRLPVRVLNLSSLHCVLVIDPPAQLNN
uniref:Ig-like domain-containing protein n=1 Tax=Heterorhabditis bacteriophora TaxID=37862 RepID=A0A1I7X5U4_HETBA